MKKALFSLAVALLVGALQALAFDEEVGIHNAMTGNPVYMNQLAAYYHSQGRYDEAVEWFMKAADKGDASSMNYLGFCYENGQGVDQDYGKAFEWYKKGADLGNASAINSVGNCYYYEHGVPRDYDLAFSYYEKAANMNLSSALVNLGGMYDEGRGCERDPDKALALYKKALTVKPNNHLAKSSIAFHHFYSLLDLEGDHQDAAASVLEFFDDTDVHPQDRPELPFVFGTCYYYTRNNEAVDLLKEAYNDRAANYSRGIAARLLGFIYNNGYCGVSSDAAEANRWFERAAALGDEDAAEVLNILHDIFNDSY